MSMLDFPREIGLRRQVCESVDDFNNYILKLNGKTSCYTSLYAYGSRHPVRRWKIDADSVVIDRAWWDFDMLEGGSLSDVKDDVRTLLNRLNGDVRLVFTGRGFHVHQFFASPVMGQAISKHIHRYQTKMAEGLKTLDGVGNPLKLTRIPDTFNPKRNKWCVNICAKSFLNNLDFKIPEKPQPEFKHLDPYRGNKPNSTFDIVTWIAKNPMQEVDVIKREFTGDISSVGQIPIPPCLDEAIKHENPKHHIRVALAQYMAEELRMFADPSSLTVEQKREMADKMVEFMKSLGWRDFNEAITRHHVESIMEYKRSPSASWYRNHGICDGTNCWAHGGMH